MKTSANSCGFWWDRNSAQLVAVLRLNIVQKLIKVNNSLLMEIVIKFFSAFTCIYVDYPVNYKNLYNAGTVPHNIGFNFAFDG